MLKPAVAQYVKSLATAAFAATAVSSVPAA